MLTHWSLENKGQNSECNWLSWSGLPITADQLSGLLVIQSDSTPFTTPKGVGQEDMWLTSLFETQRQALDLLLQVVTGQGQRTEWNNLYNNLIATGEDGTAQLHGRT